VAQLSKTLKNNSFSFLFRLLLVFGLSLNLFGFSENFSNGLSNWTIQNNDDLPGSIEVVNGKLNILRTNAGGNGGSVGIKQDVDIDLSGDMMISFDAKAISRSVGDGCGWTCQEYPINVQLTLENSNGNTYVVKYSANYGGKEKNIIKTNISSKTYGTYDFKQITKDIPQNKWTHLSFDIKKAFSDAVKIKSIYIYGNGWNFESGIDNLKIYNKNNSSIKSNTSNKNHKTIPIKKGWNLIGLPGSFSLNNNIIQLLWTNDGSNQYGGWKVYSSIKSLQNYIANNNIPTIKSINPNRGYWYLSDANKNLSIQDDKATFNNDILKSGWNLIGTNSDLSIKNIKCPNSYHVSSIWKFKNGKWLMHTNIQNSLNLEDFDTIFANEGSWVYCKKSQFQQIMCSDNEKNVNGVCIEKTCKDDGYACPVCDTQNKVLKYNSDGSGYCEAKPKQSLYTGNWSGTGYIYLINDPSTYCKWHYSVKINSDEIGNLTSTLIEHQKDDGYCASSGYVTFKITNENSNGFSGKITSSNIAIFGNTYSFSLAYQNNILSNTIDINIKGYPARRELVFVKQ